MGFHEGAALLSVAMVLVGVSRYIYATITGKASPSRATWWIFTLVSGLILASTLLSGKPNPSVWQLWTFLFTALLIAVLSLFKGQGGWGKYDKLCLTLAGISIAVWLLLLGNPNASRIVLLLTITARFMGIIPTFIKAYRDPKSEDVLAWSILTAATIVNLFAVKTWALADWHVFAFPVYAVIEAVPVFYMITTRRRLRI